MSIQNTLLLITGLINLLMSIIVISRGARNKINVYFSLLTFFNFLWAGGLFLSRILLFVSGTWIFWSTSTYFAAMGIAIFLFYFTIHFPFPNNKNKTYSNYITCIIFFLLTFVIFKHNLFITNYTQNSEQNIYVLYYNKVLYVLYSIYFMYLIIASIINLLNKYKKAELFLRTKIMYFLMAIIIGAIFGSFFDLLLCYSHIFIFNWLGPLFTLPINFVAIYLIYSNKEKNY